MVEMTRNGPSSKPQGHLRFFFEKIELEEENKQTNKEHEKKKYMID